MKVILALVSISIIASDPIEQSVNAQLFDAIRKNNTELAIIAIEMGADVNAKEGYLKIQSNKFNNEIDNQIKIYTNSSNQNSIPENTPLASSASSDKNIVITKILIEQGANLNTTDIYGNNPLMIASMLGQAESVQELLECGAAVNMKNKSGYTAIALASLAGEHIVVKMLLDHNANPDFKIGGKTALELAEGSLNKMYEWSMFRPSSWSIRVRNQKTNKVKAKPKESYEKTVLLLKKAKRHKNK